MQPSACSPAGWHCASAAAQSSSTAWSVCEFARAQSGRIAFFGGALSGTVPWDHSQRPAGNCATGHILSGVSSVRAAAGFGSARAGFFERTHRESCAADSPAMGERGVRSAKLVS